MKWLLDFPKASKETKNNQLKENVRVSLAGSYIATVELPTLFNNGPRNGDMIRMGCARASDAQGSNDYRRQPATTHEVFLGTRSRQPEASESLKIGEDILPGKSL